MVEMGTPGGILTTMFDVGQKFIGLKESAGSVHNPAIVAMLRLDAQWIQDDETAWCSAYVNYLAWLLGLPRSRSLAARSWLAIGVPLDVQDARPANDVVILSRGAGAQPDATVTNAPGHVGLFAGLDTDRRVRVLGGNQGNAVSIETFSIDRMLGVRRLY